MRPSRKPGVPTRAWVPGASFCPCRLTRMTHADVPAAVQILAELCLRDLPLPRRHAAVHTHPTRSSDSRCSARSAPPRFSASSPVTGRLTFAQAAPAVLSVTRAGLDGTSTRNVGVRCRHDARAAAARSMGYERRRKPRSTISPYASPWSAAALWLTARSFARECTSVSIIIMTESTSTMHCAPNLAAGRLPAAIKSHKAGRSASII